MRIITQGISGRIPQAIPIRVSVAGIYEIRTTPKNVEYTIQKVKGERFFDLEEGQYMLNILKPNGATFRLWGVLLLSQERREQQAEEMRQAIEEDEEN